MFKKAFLIGIIVIALAAGCTNKDKEATTGVAPDFTLQDLSGKNISLAELKGKVVLLDFWATWCPPCRASVPGIERLQKTYGKNGLVILGISLDEGDWEGVQTFTKESGITYPVLKGTQEVASKYMVRMIPTLIVVNREGMVTKQYMGFGNDEALEKDIKALL